MWHVELLLHRCGDADIRTVVGPCHPPFEVRHVNIEWRTSLESSCRLNSSKIGLTLKSSCKLMRRPSRDRKASAPRAHIVSRSSGIVPCTKHNNQNAILQENSQALKSRRLDEVPRTAPLHTRAGVRALCAHGTRRGRARCRGHEMRSKNAGGVR